MATVGFYLDTRREKKDGTFPVKLQVRHKGQIMLCTDFCATPETWTGTEYNKNAKNHKAKNVAIRNLINRVEMLLVIQHQYLQPIITQYFIDNKSEIWLLFLIAHSKR